MSRVPEVVVRLVLVGDSGTGKTSLLVRYVENTFSPSFISTVGIDFRMRTIMVGDTKVKVQVFDTAGQERFRSITKAYYRNADGAILLYDITDGKSFEHISRWAQEMEPYVIDAYKMLAGNKSDLENSRVVKTEDGKKLAKEIGYQFKETSALNGNNVEEIFMEMLHSVLKNKNLKGDVRWMTDDMRKEKDKMKNNVIKTNETETVEGGGTCMC